MAEGLFNSICEKDNLPHRASSCGIAAFDGSGASINAILAARELGTDIRSHRSRLITNEMCKLADRIYCVSEQHEIAVLSVCPEAEGKITVLSPPVPDPYGKGINEYRKCAEVLKNAVVEIIKELKV